jgi:uncharacterized RDD family membrane protein YckC
MGRNAKTSPWTTSMAGGAARSPPGAAARHDAFEDETQLSREVEPRKRSEPPEISKVGFTVRIPADRVDTEVDFAPLNEPWEEIVDASKGPASARWDQPADRTTQPQGAARAPSAQARPPEKKRPFDQLPTMKPQQDQRRAPTVPPPLQRKTVATGARPPPVAPKAREETPLRPALDADTDEGVTSDSPPRRRAATAEGRAPTRRPPPPKEDWPAASTKPVNPPFASELPSFLLENKPVTGAKPPASPGDRPSERTRHGALLHPREGQGGETIAAPGELAGLMARGEEGLSRPELVDDLLSPVSARKPSSEGIGDTRQVEELREHRRAAMRKSVETTSPENLASLLPPEVYDGRDRDGRDLRDRQDTRRPDPPKPPLEETHALIENPLFAPMPDVASAIIPSPRGKTTASDPLVPRTADPAGEERIHLTIAPAWRRALALIVDSVVVASLIVAPVLLGAFGSALTTVDWIDPDEVGPLILSGDLFLPAIALVVVALVFSALSHGLSGRSLGKMITGLELVVFRTGKRAGMARATIRALLSLACALAGGAGYLWILVDRRSRTLHDVLTGTIVVVASSRVVSTGDRTFAQEPTL